MSDVTAVVIGPAAGAAQAALPADQVNEVALASSLGTIHRAALAAATPLVWLLDAGARPLPGTLPALIDRVPAPAVSLPVDPRGDAVEALMGRVAEDVEGILDAVGRHCLPLRHTHVRSLLLERELLLELAPPDRGRFGWYAGEEWTGRLFARRRGMLIPASRVVVQDAAPGSPLHVLRAARSGGWGSGETVRELARAALRRR